MKKVIVWVIVVAATVLISGCKVEAVVEEGGSVVVFSYPEPLVPYDSKPFRDVYVLETCGDMQTCQYPIENPNFESFFWAQPSPGWFFAGWARGEMSLCSEIVSNLCPVNLSDLDPIDAQTIIDTGETAYLRPVFKPVSENRSIIVDGREWYQPSLFADLSWSEIAEVCPDGYCAGSLNDIDLTGWRWATVNNVNRLLNFYLGEGALGLGPDYVDTWDNSKASEFFGGAGWAPNYSGVETYNYVCCHIPFITTSTYLSGLTRNQRARFPDKAWVAYIAEYKSMLLDSF